MIEPYPRAYLYKRIVQAKLYMDTNYHTVIDLDNIADEAYFSKFHFIRLFRSIYGKTPHQYLTSVRMEQAKQLLRSGVASKEVAFRVGFESIPSFTGLFKRYAGRTPAEWQKEYLNREQEIATRPLAFSPSCFAANHGWLQKSNFEEVL